MTALPEEIPAPIVLPQEEDPRPETGDSYYSDGELYVWDGDEWVLTLRTRVRNYNATTESGRFGN